MERTLGRGGMGAVYQATDTSTGETLALKRLTESSSARHVALFEREYHTLASLAHPNVVAVKDYGADAQGPYYTMELLEGQDVSRLGPLPWREVCGLLRQVAVALSLLHARRLVHRDVNPRNLWQTPDGTIKLLDFGALAPFGQADHIVGTPPCVPPEALYGQMLDHRSDLYALGTVGYWLLTARHAYPARALGELKLVWQQAPRPPSAWVQNLERPDLETPPRALDDLVMALLAQEPMMRPSSAGEVIERLDAIAGLEPTPTQHVAEAHVASAAFAGRERELSVLMRGLDRAREGRGSSVVIAGERGTGRSRLLAETALRAGLRGATVVRASGAEAQGPAGVGLACARQLLNVAPEQARKAAGTRARTLGHLSADLREAFGLGKRDLEAMPQTPGEARMRLQEAMFEWFAEAAREVPLAVLVDDLHAADEASAAWLAQLVQSAEGLKLFVVTTVDAQPQEDAAATRSIRRNSTALLLSPMGEPEMLEMLRSMFGDVPHLQRLSDKVHGHSGGNPAHAMELAEYLVRSEAVRFTATGWLLPQQLDDEHWPQTRGAGLIERADRLGAGARAAARSLSVMDGPVPLENCPALTGLEARELFEALDELSRVGVLEGAADGYQFAHAALRDSLREELPPAERAAVHARLAEAMLEGERTSPLTRLQAAVHGMRGAGRAHGPTSKYGGLAVQAALEFITKRHHELREAVPHLEAAHEMFVEADRPRHERAVLLTALAMSGYYAERHMAERYADRALDLLQEVLWLPTARRLQRWLGGRLALYIALMCAAVGFARRRGNPRVPAFMQAVVMLLNTVAVTTGVYALSLDPRRAASYAEILRPLCALGRDHAATISYKLSALLASTPTDRLARTHAEWEALLARLRDPKPIRGLNDELRTFFAAGARSSKGIIECYRDGPDALRTADELEAIGYRIYEMSADQLRTLYHAHQGNLALSEHYRRKVEMHAIARGTAWQVEAWLPGPMMALFLRTQDAAGMKRQVQQLERLVRKLPSLETYLTRSLGAYHLLSGHSREALPLLEKGLAEPTRDLIGWARGHAAMAAALNDLGDHPRALEVCERALAAMDEGDVDFCGTNLGVVMEHARARARLGHLEEAIASIDALIDRYTPLQGPITLGSLHELRLELAQAAADADSAAFHAQQMRHWYTKTDVPALLRRAARTGDDPGTGPDAEQRAEVNSTVESLLHRLTHGFTCDGKQTAEWMLSQLAEFAGFAVGYLLKPGQGGCVQLASLDGSVAPPELVAWARERAEAFVTTADATEMMSEDSTETQDRERCTIDGTPYRLRYLEDPSSPVPRLVAVLVAEDSRLVRQTLSLEVLEQAAQRLADSLEDQDATRPDVAASASGNPSQGPAAST